MGCTKAQLAAAKRYRNRHKGKIQVYNTQWHRNNRKRDLAYDRNVAAPRRAELREQVIAKLGGCCAAKDCRWLNRDGTLGCKDASLLHIDHVKGKGGKERKVLSGRMFLLHVLKSRAKKKYQLLCANCNWRKRQTNNEIHRKK
jgi:hypothetical protein